MRLIGYITSLLLVLSSSAFSDIFKTGSLQATSDGVNVTLHWITDDETNVARFEVERSSGFDNSFVTIATVDPKGPSLYEFVDNSAFRRVATLYQYRIKVVFSNGAMPVYSQTVSVSHTVSGVRRTWGSIKSLFR